MPKNRLFRFAFVSNSAQIANSVKAFENPEREHIEIRLASMEEALPVAKDCLAGGVEVVLGGGATGRLLREKLKLPVVTIARRDMDVIHALLRAKEHSHRIGLTSFGGATSGVDLMASILDVDIRLLEFRTTPELVNNITQAVQDGYRCIVGGGVCKTIAETVGGEGFVVVPGDRVIQQALEEARVIAESQRRTTQEAERLRVILHSVKEGVVGIDSKGNIDLINPVAADMFRLDAETVMNKPMPRDLQGAGLRKVLESGEAEVDKFRTVAGVDMFISSLPVNVSEDTRAVVATFTRTSRIQDLDRRLKEKLYTKGFMARYSLDDFTGACSSVVRLREKALQYARTEASILIQGETGTGKEILAQGIHLASQRHRGPFVAVNCSALSETLLESELFGYEEGAFTGAKRGGKQGLFELASGGTLFLDELADVSHSIQVRLLRVIEEKAVMRVGGDRIVPVDVRILASSYKDLAQAALLGTFRSDLYFRIATLKLNTIPLRERIEDIPILIESLLKRYSTPSSLSLLPLSQEVFSRMKNHPWFGNIRELDSLIQRFLALFSADKFDEQKLAVEIMNELFNETRPVASITDIEDTNRNLKQQLQKYEIEIIEETLGMTENNKAKAAKILGISVNSLWRKLRNN
ncbi:MAG: sigma 54-interacting transcriptional regulator [Desulfoplanes sp.]